MDLTVLLSTLLGLFIASRGYFGMGVAFAGVPLVVFVPAFRRLPKTWLLFPLKFAGWWVAFGLAILVSILFRGGPTYLQIFPHGIALYYYGCVALVEKKIRYVPPAGLFSWNEARRRDQPVAYWLLVSLVFFLSAVFLGIALSEAGRT
jgi:hypothetical protein